MPPELGDADVPIEDRHNDVIPPADPDNPAIKRGNLLQCIVVAGRGTEKERNRFVCNR